MPNQEELVSVILPCYNAMPYLPEALDSIINQTYTNLEILCINDGSTDNTGEILEEFAKQDSRIRVIHNEDNIKLIRTLNKGISLAKGGYIARMDADDISYLDRIEKLYNALVENKADIVSCISERIDKSGKRFAQSFLKALSPIEVKFGSYFFTPIGHALLVGKREAFLNHPYSLEENAVHTEDYELWTRMIRNDVKLMGINEVLYSYRIYEDSVSRKYEDIQKKNFLLTAQIHQEALLNQKLETSIVAIAVNRNESFNYSEFLKGYRLTESIFDTFVVKNKTNKDETQSIRKILSMHQTDLMVQSLKKGDFKTKIHASLLLSRLLLLNVFNSRYRAFLSHKF